MSYLKKVTRNYELYELDRRFKDEKNVIKYIDEAQDFYNGNQYPNENYNNMIRVTLNICSFAASIKASKVAGTPIYLTYTADDNTTDCIALQRFDEYNQMKMNLNTNNYQAALNGFVNGTEITYIRWDDDDTSYKGIYKGGLVEEHIDLRNFAVANPYIHSIQAQEWVMFWEDYALEAVKNMVDEPDDLKRAHKLEILEQELDSEEDNYKNKDNINHKLVRVFTRFFRKEGEVFFECSTDNVNLFDSPKPLSRKLSQAYVDKLFEIKDEEEYIKESTDKIIDYDIDSEDIPVGSLTKEDLSFEEYKKIKEKFNLYPFAVYRPYLQNRFFYGRSDIKSLIPIQKGMNFSYSMMLKCIENNAYNKIFAKSDALGDQVITNEPSQVLYDYSSFTNGWGIKFAESQPLPNGLMDFADRMLGTTRVVYGFNDVMDGSIRNQDMSGYMLQQMIQQSNTSILQQQQLFWDYNVDMAEIRLLYYKHYVDKAKYTYERSDAEYNDEEQARQVLYKASLAGQGLPANPNAKPEDFEKPTHKTLVKEFDTKDLYGVSFDIAIDALQGTNDSKLIEQQTWDNLLLNGGIQNISPDILEMYLECSPNISQRTKTSLRTVVDNLKKGEISRLQESLNQLSGETQELMNYTKNLEAQMGYQSQYLKNLQAEFANKINMSNKMNQALMNDLRKYKEGGVSEGEQKSKNATSSEAQQEGQVA